MAHPGRRLGCVSSSTRESATYFNRYDAQNPDGTFTGGIDQSNPATGGIVPRWKHYLSVNWSRGPWSLTFAQNFQKGYTDIPGTFTGQPPRGVVRYRGLRPSGPRYSGFRTFA